MSREEKKDPAGADAEKATLGREGNWQRLRRRLLRRMYREWRKVERG